MNTSVLSNTFGEFPKFTKLTIADKQAYDDFIAQHPPIDDFSFQALMTWWNPLDSMSIAQLNGNLIVPFWLAGDERHSGLSLVGTNKVDETICSIFDYQIQRGMPARLVNVPEFVLTHIEYPELFYFKEERKYSEYVYPVGRFYDPKHMPLYWRKRIQRLLKRVGAENITVRSLDLRDAENVRLIQQANDEWQSKGINDYGKVEADSIREHLISAIPLGVGNLCLFVDNKLLGFCFYEISPDGQYVSVRHIKATSKTAIGFELMGYEFGKWAAGQGISYVNLSADFGMIRLRMFMLALGPVNFFRKYSIEPAF